MKPGQALHAIYRSEFQHRWGGNTPSWRSLSNQERALWANIELRAHTELLPAPIAAKIEVSAGERHNQTA